MSRVRPLSVSLIARKFTNTPVRIRLFFRNEQYESRALSKAITLNARALLAITCCNTFAALVVRSQENTSSKSHHYRRRPYTRRDIVPSDRTGDRLWRTSLGALGFSREFLFIHILCRLNTNRRDTGYECKCNLRFLTSPKRF